MPSTSNEFRTEVDRFAKVILVGPTTAPDSFTIYLKNGLILTYGGTANARASGPRITWSVPTSDPADPNPPVPSEGVPVTYAWGLSSVSDRVGSISGNTSNVMTIAYRNEFGTSPRFPYPFQFVEFLPEEIRYNAGSMNGPTSLRFIYGAARSDASYMFVSGLGIKHTLLLTRIEAIGHNPHRGELPPGPLQLLRSYDLVYDMGPVTGRPRLRSLTECDQSITCKNPTTFDWEDGSSQYSDWVDPALMTAADNSQFWVRDIDGDGKDDIAYSINGDLGTYVYRRSLGSSLSSIEFPLVLGSQTSGKIEGIYLTDLDLDGKADLSYLSPAGSNNGATLYSPDPSFPNGDLCRGGAGSVCEFPFPAPASSYFADLDGDGLAELMTPVTPFGTAFYWNYARNNVHPFGAWIFSKDAQFQPSDYQPLTTDVIPLPIGSAPSYMISLDASGRQSFLHQGGSGIRYGAFQLKRSGATAIVPTTLRIADGNPGGRYYVMIDVNGDGLTDALEVSDSPYYSSLQSQGAALSANTGAGFTGPANAQGAPFVSGVVVTQDIYRFNSEKQPGYAVADVNQDGLPDILFMGAAPSRSEIVALTAAIGTVERGNLVRGGYVTLQTGAHIPVAAKFNENYAFAQIGDFNGDGLVDFVERPATDSSHFHLYIHQGKKADQVVGITTSTHARTEISYQSIADPNVHMRATDCNYPLYCLKKGMWVVDRYSTSTDLGDYAVHAPLLKSFSVQHAGARSDALRGWLGFAKQTVTDGQSGAVSVTTYDNTTRIGSAYPYAMLPHQQGEIVREQGPSAGLPYRMITTHHYEAVPLPGSAIYSVRTRDTYVQQERLTTVPTVPLADALFDSEQPHETLFFAATSLTYDGYNNVTDATTVTKRNIYKSSCPIIDNDPTNWVLGACRKAVESSTTDTLATATRTTTFDYYSGTLLKKTLTVEPTGDDSVQSTTVYLREANGRGQPTRITTTAKATAQDPAAPPGQTLTRQWEITYDPDSGVFPTTIKNPLEQVTEFNYHAGLGVLISMRDPNHVETTYQFDGFGRLAGVRPPGAGEIKLSYLPATSGSELSGGSLPEYAVQSDQFGGAHLRVTYNHNNHEILRERAGSAGMNQNLTGYSLIPGQVTSTTRWSDPFSQVGSRATTRYEYDNLRRLLKVILPDNKIERYSYDVLANGGGLASPTETSTTITKPNGAQVEVDRDDLGHISRVIEKERGGDGRTPGQSVTTYVYGPFGQLASVLPPNDVRSVEVSFHYDALGRRTSWLDADFGSTTTSYNGFGEVVAEFDAAGAKTSFVRDALGRVTDRQNFAGMGDQQTYVWDTAPNGIGKLASSFSHSLGGVGKTYGYDYFGRVQTINWDIATPSSEHQTFVIEQHYDGFGRVDRVDYPLAGTYRLAARFDYDQAGLLLSTTSAGSRPGNPPPSTYWFANERTPDDWVSLETAGSGVQTRRVFDPSRGWLNSITSPVQSVTYDHDDNGNVSSRHDRYDPANPVDEVFQHTDLDMLYRWSVFSPAVTGDIRYDPRGDGTLGGRFRTITAPFSEFTYSSFDYNAPGQAHAVSKITSTNSNVGTVTHDLTYDSNGNQTTSAFGLHVGVQGYTSFGLPVFIGAAEGEPLDVLKYDAGGHRTYKADLTKGSVPEETFYVGDLYEMRRGPDGVTHIFYVPGEDRTVAQETWSALAGGPGISQNDILYFHEDIIGSLDAISSASGQNNAQLRYEPYGRRVNFANRSLVGAPFSIPGVSGSTVTRGFTFHEMDDETGFINMCGRLFDPVIGRFLTPDPIRQDPWTGSNYDGYAYVYNNPLRWTDPSGYASTRRSPFPDIPNTGQNSLGVEPPPAFNQANQRVADLTAEGILGSGDTVGVAPPTPGGGGPGGTGVIPSGVVDDNPSSSGGNAASSPVAGAGIGGVPQRGGSQGSAPPPRSNFFGDQPLNDTFRGMCAAGLGRCNEEAGTFSLKLTILPAAGEIAAAFNWLGRMLGLGGEAAEAGAANVLNIPKPPLPSGMGNKAFGELMRWGTGKDAALARIQTLTRAELEQAGVTKEVAKAWAEFYRAVVEATPKNPSAAGRAALMDAAAKLLE